MHGGISIHMKVLWKWRKNLLKLLGITRLGVDKVKPKGWFWGCGDFRYWGLGLLAEDGGLLQVLPLTVHLKQTSRGDYSETFLLSELFLRPLLDA